jgi:hypothetical protein
MRIAHQHPYPLRDMTPDERRAIIQRAHEERAAAIRAFLSNLLAWRGSAGGNEHPSAGTAPAPSH